jgi:two-component system phosphate regulon sensor histidine kinase PhoR
MSNTSFNTMVNSTASEGKFYWELIRSPRIGKMIETVLRHPEQSTSEEIDVDNRHFMCSVSYLATAEQIVLALHDVTDIMSVAKMKKDFVQNVSHELRTPLTAIKGFVETMEEEKTEANKQYLEIIKRHTDRLIHIVKDLQVLSELEEVETIELEEIRLDELVGPLLRLFMPRAQEKNLALHLHYDKDCPAVMADRFKIEQMFINLIDNAIKYTEKGAIDITIQPEDEEICITVADTGIGIPHEKLDRIFERFYVIDKSRSRTLGGTGLGLSIVKHIVNLHEGRIQVESTLHKGSKLSIYLPKTP